MNCYDRHYLKIALPAALEGLFMILLASTDLILVGALGSLSVAAVSIFLQPRLILLCFSHSLASAVTLAACNHAGSGDRERSADLLKKSLVIGALLMGVLHVLFFYFLEDIFLLMGASADYLPLAMEYGPMALLAVYFTSLTLILQAVLLGYGDTSSIMKTNISGNLLNACLSFVLIRGLGPVPAFGVAGAAFGTAAGTLFLSSIPIIFWSGRGSFMAAAGCRTGHISKRWALFCPACSVSRAVNASAWCSFPAWPPDLARYPLRCTVSV